MSNTKVEALSEEAYLLMKERLLAKLREALDSFVVEEQAANPSVQRPDFLYAQMEVLLDLSASSALATEETNRGDFVDAAFDSFNSMVDLMLEDTKLEGGFLDLVPCTKNEALNLQAMECSSCGADHGPSDSCVLYESPFYAIITDYPAFFLTKGGAAVVYVVPCDTHAQGELVREFIRETENLYGSSTSSYITGTQAHQSLHDPDVGCFYIYRWHPELLDEAKSWRRA